MGVREPVTRMGLGLVYPFYPQLSEPLQDQSLGVATMERERGGRRPRKSSILCSFCLLPPKEEQVWAGRQDAWVLGGWEGVGSQWRGRRGREAESASPAGLQEPSLPTAGRGWGASLPGEAPGTSAWRILHVPQRRSQAAHGHRLAPCSHGQRGRPAQGYLRGLRTHCCRAALPATGPGPTSAAPGG